MKGTPRALDSSATSALRRLRMWPFAVCLVLLAACKGVLEFGSESMEAMMLWGMGPLVCVFLVFLWWVIFSRASWKERLAGVVGVGLLGWGAMVLAHPSMQGIGGMLYTIPTGVFAFGVGVWLFRSRSQRLLYGLAFSAVGFAIWCCVRMDGMSGQRDTVLSGRWAGDAEADYLANRQPLRATEASDTPTDVGNVVWPGFRGPHRDSVCAGVSLNEDWVGSPPEEHWRIRVGPGWSSFAVSEHLVFTQEQRGDLEAVVCYAFETGSEVWSHTDSARFWEAMGSVGPRATPSLTENGEKLVAQGATGLLNCLAASTGELLWQRDVAADSARAVPTWGFAGSPLIHDDLVIVHTGAPENKGLLAYDLASGELRWSASASGEESYSSPQLSELCGLQVVLMFAKDAFVLLDPVTGELLLTVDCSTLGYRVAQPWVVGDDRVILGTQRGEPMRCLQIQCAEGQWSGQELWVERGISPDFNDAVLFDGCLYGFDSSIFACADIATGKRLWKRGRYGNGQVLLFPEQAQLLVLSEQGQLHLLRATPSGHEELGRFPVLEGMTWNHPVCIGDRLLVRNATEAVCLKLPLEESSH